MKNFKKEVVDAYTQHTASDTLPANLCMARSLIPPGTGAYRDFSSIASELPHFISQNCVGCMACVVECPDTAILGKVVEEDVLKEALKENESLKTEFTKTTKYYTTYEKRGRKPGLFQIAIDPTKCKGCGECVTVCGDHNALKMVSKSETVLKETGQKFDFFKKLPPTPKDFIQEKILSDFMLSPDALLYVGGAGSCMGCGEATGIRMMLAATGFVHGQHSCGIVAATGCNTVYGSTYPYNPYLVSWTNSLFENACAVAMGIRARWDQQGLHPKKLWVLGGDGAMLDIGFQSLSRLLMSGLDINILVLDTQAYSNTGGQASTATFTSQNAKMAAHGSKLSGKSERRKELSNIALMHPDVYVAQTVTSMTTHFYQAILRANEFPGPALVNVYASCPPEHGIRDNAKPPLHLELFLF